MFENLTPRERILSLAVLTLVPIGLLFMGVFWFIGKYNDNNMQIVGLTDQVNSEESKMLAAKKANIRRNYYRSISLPSDIVDASNDYQTWLLKLVRDEIKMSKNSIKPQASADLRVSNKTIGRTKQFTLLVDADLQQFTDFLTRFYSVDLLHRISSIKINPISMGAAGGKKLRTGKLSLSITIEVVSLVDADISRDFTQQFRKLNRTAEEYQTAILRRNIFGPANNLPTIAARPSSSYTSDTDIKVSVSGNDLDENDLLKFELAESSIEGAKLIQSDEKDRRASLEIPGQPEGKYEFKILVRDNGFPAKQTEEVVSVTFKNRPPKSQPAKDPEKPPFKHATQTRITSIVKDKSDHWFVWIKVRTTGESYQLQVNESFELDGKQWTVRSIEPSRAIIEVESQLLTFRPTDPFDQPRASEALAVAPPAEEIGS